MNQKFIHKNPFPVLFASLSRSWRRFSSSSSSSATTGRDVTSGAAEAVLLTGGREALRARSGEELRDDVIADESESEEKGIERRREDSRTDRKCAEDLNRIARRVAKREVQTFASESRTDSRRPPSGFPPKNSSPDSPSRPKECRLRPFLAKQSHRKALRRRFPHLPVIG
jgi:hypothetical protein